MHAHAAAHKKDDDQWMEIFYSKPAMKNAYLLERLPSGEFTEPCEQNRLQPGDDVRPGFRVFRRRAENLEFKLTNGSDITDDNSGTNYSLTHPDPGRYIVESGVLQYVGNVDAGLCRQACSRYGDRYVHIVFHAPLWEVAYAYFQRHATEWTPLPGEKMTTVCVHGQKTFELVIAARALVIAFHNGDDVWDSNEQANYHISLPGKYEIRDGKAIYLAPSDKDLQIDPKGSARPPASDKLNKTLTNVTKVSSQHTTHTTTTTTTTIPSPSYQGNTYPPAQQQTSTQQAKYDYYTQRPASGTTVKDPLPVPEQQINGDTSSGNTVPQQEEVAKDETASTQFKSSTVKQST